MIPFLRSVGRLLGSFSDYAAFVLTFAGVMCLTHFQPKALGQGPGILGSEVTVGLAVLGVVLASMAVLVTFMSDEYLLLLWTTKAGLRGVIRPFKVVALAGCAATIAALASAFAWTVLTELGRSLVFALCSALTVWALVGTVQLVYITAGHGERRAVLLERVRDWRGALDERRQKTSL